MGPLIKSAAIASILAMAFNANSSFAKAPQKLWELTGFNQPESVIADPAAPFLYVSNINGSPTELNGKGYIAKVSDTGTMISQHWLTGLDAPKGMAIYNGQLYVADMQKVRTYDLKSGQAIKVFEVPEAKMLNDISVGNQTIYISDTLGGAIYQIKNDQISPWIKDAHLPYPNGLHWKAGKLLAANWGINMNEDMTTQTPGTLFEIDPATGKIKAIPTGYELGNLDGIVSQDETLFVSDWVSGEIYKLKGNERTKWLNLETGLADIGMAAGVIFTPMMWGDSVSAWSVEE